MSTRILCLIPARMGSSRFPGKPMARILGKPMIQHVLEGVSRSRACSQVAVATCDQEIFDFVTSIGGRAVMTSSSHQRASDRCAEALEILERELGAAFDIVVMVQGDEPMVTPEMIDAAVGPLLNDPTILVTNLLSPIRTNEEFVDPNCIKVVVDRNFDAVYMSRAPIPHRADLEAGEAGRQVCVIPFRRKFLLEYSRMAPTMLEIRESIDMLRIIENGLKVRMVPIDVVSLPVDTPDDLVNVEELLRGQTR
jgi:3-deoxy-manno-octulosonate cytidylyltransferase (CMP-KDO synthetase)